MSIGQQFGMPGVDAIQSTLAYDITWGGTRNQIEILQAHGVHYSSVMRDAGATPTTTIRAGLIVGKNSTSGELEEWDADATDGTQDLFGVVPTEFPILDNFGTATDRNAPSAIVKAPLRARSLLIQGTVLTSHVDEFLAREALRAMGCVLDDDPQGFKAGGQAPPRYATVTGTTDTLTEAENGSVINYSNAASVTVTLPTIHAGLTYTLIRSGDEEFVITSAEGDNVIAGNDLSADSITWTTASEHLGAAATVRGIYVGTALKWVVDVTAVPFSTGLLLTSAVAT